MRHLKEFSSHSTAHGIGYVFDKELGMFDRSLWLGIVTVCVCVAVGMISSSYTTWQENMVITTLKNIAKPVDEIDFPAVTICGSGLYMENIEKTLEKRFNSWRLRNKKSWDSDDLKDLLAEFMEEKFQIKEKGLTIMDILNTMVSPNNVDNVLLSNIVRENALACEAQAANSGRKKRESSSTLLSGNHNFQLILAFDLCL